jgi:hypothetical protein
MADRAYEPLEAHAEDSAQALRNCLKIAPKIEALTVKKARRCSQDKPELPIRLPDWR